MNCEGPFPKTVCQQCIDRIELFDKYCNEVAHHQQLLQMTKFKDTNSASQLIATQTNLIQLSPTILSKESGTIIITLQTNSTSTTTDFDGTGETSIGGQEHEVLTVLPQRLSDVKTFDTNVCNIIDTDELAADVDHETMHETKDAEDSLTLKNVIYEVPTEVTIQEHIDSKSLRKNFVSIERELDSLATDDITAQIHEESDNEDLYNEDENEMADDSANAIDTLNFQMPCEQRNDFPTKLIEDSKLLYKGRDLIEMISKFYRLECDQCRWFCWNAMENKQQ